MATKLRRIHTRVLRQPEHGPKLEYFHAPDADVAVWFDVADRRLLDVEVTWESKRSLTGRSWAMWSWDKGWRTGMLLEKSPLVQPTARVDASILREAQAIFAKRLTLDKRFEVPLEQLDRVIKDETRG